MSQVFSDRSRGRLFDFTRKELIEEFMHEQARPQVSRCGSAPPSIGLSVETKRGSIVNKNSPMAATHTEMLLFAAARVGATDVQSRSGRDPVRSRGRIASSGGPCRPACAPSSACRRIGSAFQPSLDIGGSRGKGRVAAAMHGHGADAPAGVLPLTGSIPRCRKSPHRMTRGKKVSENRGHT